MKRPKNGSTIRQVAYARKLFNGAGRSKKEIAMSVGYSEAMANNALAKIEETEGFQNAMATMAVESNNLVLAAMLEFKRRGLQGFSNKDLTGALNAISSAWEKIGKQRAPNRNEDPEHNPLRKVFMQKVENQTINVTPAPAVVVAEETATAKSSEEIKAEIDLDF